MNLNKLKNVLQCYKYGYLFSQMQRYSFIIFDIILMQFNFSHHSCKEPRKTNSKFVSHKKIHFFELSIHKN